VSGPIHTEIGIDYLELNLVEWLLLSKRALKLLVAEPYAVEFFCHLVKGSKQRYGWVHISC